MFGFNKKTCIRLINLILMGIILYFLCRKIIRMRTLGYKGKHISSKKKFKPTLIPIQENFESCTLKRCKNMTNLSDLEKKFNDIGNSIGGMSKGAKNLLDGTKSNGGMLKAMEREI